MRRLALSVCLVAPVACASIAELDGFADAPPGAGGGTASAGGATSTGAGAGGAATTTTSSSTGVGGGEGGSPEVWMLYTLSGATGDLGNGQWSSQPLSLAWGGGNAPTEGVLTVADFYYFDQLVVLTDAGQVHRRDGVIWRPIEPSSGLFPLVETDGTVISSVTTPGGWPQLGTPQEDRSQESVTISVSKGATSNFYVYDLTDAFDTSSIVATGIPGDGSADCSGGCSVCEGPDRPTIKEVWAFRRLDEALIGSAGAYRAWTYYDDGNIYQFDAAFCWDAIPVAQHPMFAGKAGAPPPDRIRAAYFEEPSTVQMVVAPP